METISVDLGVYVNLLVKAGVTNPEQWPEGLRDGAVWLARIREIEAQGREQNGEWDWELLSPELQDEYDSACSALNLLRDVAGGEQDVPADAVFAELRQSVRKKAG